MISNKLNILLLVFFASVTNVLGQQKATAKETISNSYIRDKKVLPTTVDSRMPTKYSIVLYSDDITEKKGNNQKMAAHWENRGGGDFKWQKDIQDNGKYEVAISYSTKSKGSIVKVFAGKDSISTKLAITSGYYSAGNTDWYAFNCERKQIPGLLTLKKGINVISLKFVANNESPINLYSLELIPIAKKKLIEKDFKNAAKIKPNAKWFTESPYGLMFHWTSQTTPRRGAIKPYNDAVNAFDVGTFVKMVQKTGASYIIFTTNHAEPYFPAPLKSWESEYPGHTTRRDLVEEIADSLQQHNIKLILYLATHIYAKYEKVNDKEFERLNFSLLSEIGERYKKKVAGYWLDGWYQSYEKHPTFNFEKLYKVCKIGNPNRLLGLNSWVYPVLTFWQDYWAGEVYSIGNPTKTRILEDGPGVGLQTHSLIVMERDDWLHTTLNTDIKSPSLRIDDLVDFISKQKGKGPVTINIQIYQDGRISNEALSTMEAVNEKLNR